MRDFQNGKIYKITCDETGLVYYGSTTQTLKQRFSAHNCKGNKLVTNKMTNMKIELIENYPCNTHIELLGRERYYIKNHECINITVPLRTDKEYREDNRERLLEYKKKYHEENYEKEKTYRLDYNKRPEVKAKKKNYNENYYEKNKLREQNRTKQYNEKNKERLREKCNCECGSIVSRYNLHHHRKTVKHQSYISSLN